jgi:hypothetical protein
MKGEGGKETEQGLEAIPQEDKDAGDNALPATTKMRDCHEVIREHLTEIGKNTRNAWRNHMGSCHVDALLMLELAAIVAAPWRLQNKDFRRAGTHANQKNVVWT